jgi:hypothetical protein
MKIIGTAMSLPTMSSVIRGNATIENVGAGAKMGAGLVAGAKSSLPLVVENFWHFWNWRRPEGCECRGCDAWRTIPSFLHEVSDIVCQNRYLVWEEAMPNLVTTEGKNDLLYQYLKPQMSITNFALTSNVVTITTAATHNFVTGQSVLVQLVTNAAKNGIFVVTGTTSNTFTYAFTASNVGSGADTGTVGFSPTWYVGLVDNASFTAYAAADTLASHGGWFEGVPYSNANRVTWTGGAVSAGSVDNSGSVASFNINATLTVRGAFLASNNTKSGTTGRLYGEADFASARSVLSGDTLNVTVTLTAS